MHSMFSLVGGCIPLSLNLPLRACLPQLGRVFLTIRYTQIPQPKIENSRVQLQTDCLKRASKFRYSKKIFEYKFLVS